MSKQARGIWLAAGGAALWGASGAAAQYLFEQTPVTTAWLVAVRLLVAGGILTAVSWHRNPLHLRELTRYRWAWWHLLGYSVLGTLFSQLAYFLAVKASNAATATVLQYLQPVLIIIWVALASRKWPRRIDNFSVLLALLGTFLLITDGHPGSLTLTPLALFWGLLCAVAAALCTLLPVRLLKHFDTLAVSGLAMLVGGILMLPELFLTPWPHLTWLAWLMVAYVVIFGTLLAYTMVLASLNYISPTATGILGAFEPLLATVLAVGLLGTRLTPAMVVGSLMILATTFLQALPVDLNPFGRLRAKHHH
ncbi:DMT family transporter [Limosilactobacillus ingluviei]